VHGHIRASWQDFVQLGGAGSDVVYDDHGGIHIRWQVPQQAHIGIEPAG
jgi:hypothetical protein